MQHGSERPVAFTSRTLAPAEKKHSQLDKEALSIIFGVKRFHQYLYGLQFVIHSDHKPLMYIFDESKVVPLMVSVEDLTMGSHSQCDTYTIQYKAGKDHTNADGLSRLPLEDAPTEMPKPAETILLMDHLAQLHQCQLATSDCRLTTTLPCPRQGSLSNTVCFPRYQTPVTCIHFIARDTSSVLKMAAC